MRRGGLRRAAFLVSAAWLGALSGTAPATSPPTVLIHEPGTSQLLGRGILIAGQAGCVILTANHLIEPKPKWVRPMVEWQDPSSRAMQEAAPGEGPANAAFDYVILKPATPPPQCGELPPLRTIEAAIRVGAAADVELVQAGGQARLIAGRIVVTTDSSFGIAHGGDTIDWAAPGMSGSLVSIGGVPAGMLIGVNPNKADQILVLRLDFVARVAQRWLAPPERSPRETTAAAASDPDRAARAFWNGVRLGLIGREASARREFEAAAAAGSAAAGVALAQMLLLGQGGPADRDRGSILFDRHLPAAISQARSGDAAAAFILVYLHSDGMLTSEQQTAARTAVRSVAERLRARAGGDTFASSLLASIVFIDTGLARDISYEKIGKLLGVTEYYAAAEPLLEINCQQLGCFDVQSAALRSMLVAMEGGSNLAAAILAHANLETLAYASEAGELPIPDCTRLSAASTSPIGPAALASCTRLRRMAALQRFDPIAFDTAGDRRIWEQAVESGMYIYPWNLHDMAGQDQQAREKVTAFARTAFDREQNRLAGLHLAYSDLLNGRVAAGLEGLRAYVAAAPQGEEAASALGELAAAELLGAPGVAADPARARSTLATIKNLSSENIVEAILGLEAGARRWGSQGTRLPPVAGGAAPYGAQIIQAAASSAYALETIQSDLPAEIERVRTELLRVAADKGSYEAALQLIEDGMDPAPLAQSDPRRRHAYVKAALQVNPINGAKLVCKAAQLQAAKSGSKRDAIRLCRSLFDAGLTATAAPLALLYQDDAAARRAMLERASIAPEAASILLRDLLREPRPDYPHIHRLLRRLAARGETDAVAVTMRLLAGGKLPWDKSYFQYLARMVHKLGYGFDCWPVRPTGGTGGFGGGTGCLLAVEEADIGWYGPPFPGSVLPKLSAAQIAALEEALRLSGDSIWFRKDESGAATEGTTKAP